MTGSKNGTGGMNPSSKTFVPGGSGRSSKKPSPSSSTTRASTTKAAAPGDSSSSGKTNSSLAKASAKTVTPPASPPKMAAWGSKPLDAVRAAPPPSFAAAAAKAKPPPPRNNTTTSTRSNSGGSGKWGSQGRNNHGGRSSGGRDKQQQRQRGGGRRGDHNKHHHHHHDHSHKHGHHSHSHSDHNKHHHSRKPALPLLQPSQGSTKAQQVVKRFTAQTLLEFRLTYLETVQEWSCPEACHWTHEDRITTIQTLSSTPRMTGDVSLEKRRSKKPPVETAPPLEECKPLQVNDETRWKAKVMKKNEVEEQEDSDDDVLKKALLILNKLSLTKFDKLSQDFVDTGIGRNKACLEGAICLIVQKAQDEAHFAEMYARLCFKLSGIKLEGESPRAFKKLLLKHCQEEFETDTVEKIAKATEGITDPEEVAYRAGLVKRHYLGHMRFIGELYKGDMIKIEIMLWCLRSLLPSDEVVDEEKVECFAKLMTTVGSDLQHQSQVLERMGKPESSKQLNECWKQVQAMVSNKRGGPVVSNRVKFMLQDLQEMRDKGWVTRRKQETAKTIEQIHQEVAKEERKAARRSSSSSSLRASLGPRRASSGDVRLLDRRDSKQKIVDEDGFVQISSSGSSKKMPALHRSVSDITSSRSTRPAKRSSSSGRLDRKGQKPTKPPQAEPEKKKETPKEQAKVEEYPSPQECGKKAKSILKEYFVGGDTDEAVLSFHEMIGAPKAGSVERGGKAVEDSILLVMEMKETDVDKTILVLNRCIQEKKLEKESIALGLNDPLEFLADIMVDAPLANVYLAKIVAEFIKLDALSLDHLLRAPEYFHQGGQAAKFAAKVLKGTEPTDSDVEVVEKLMTDNDKKAHDSARDLIAAA